jgi:hypothetical protein
MNHAEHVSCFPWYAPSRATLLGDFQIAQSFAEAVTAVVHVERSGTHGQVVREIAEVYPVVEQVAARPAFNFLFKFDKEKTVSSTAIDPHEL